MARKRITDYILSNKFHVFDASTASGPVLSPLAGFTSVTLPVTSAELKEIKEGNQGSKKAVYKTHDFSDLILERGTALLTADFHDWMDAFIKGDILDKNLIIMQYTNIDGGLAGDIISTGVQTLASGGGFSAASAGNLAGNLFRRGVASVAGLEPNEFSNYLPAKGWMCKACKPKAYDPGGRLDASANEISIQRLELSLEDVKEFSTGITF